MIICRWTSQVIICNDLELMRWMDYCLLRSKNRLENRNCSRFTCWRSCNKPRISSLLNYSPCSVTDVIYYNFVLKALMFWMIITVLEYDGMVNSIGNAKLYILVHLYSAADVLLQNVGSETLSAGKKEGTLWTCTRKRCAESCDVTQWLWYTGIPHIATDRGKESSKLWETERFYLVLLVARGVGYLMSVMLSLLCYYYPCSCRG